MNAHDAQERILAEGIRSGRLAHAWLLAGPQGVGKARFAERAAAYYLCFGDRAVSGDAAQGLAVDPAHPALALIANRSHPEYVELRRELPESKRSRDAGDNRSGDLARNITIAQVRALLSRLRMRPADDGRRCIIIDAIDDLERGAANALLKTLEEPPDRTLFLLISHNPGRLLPTIRSRCRYLRFSALDDAQMQAALSDLTAYADPAVIPALMAIAHGGPGRARYFQDCDVAAINGPLTAIASHGDRDNQCRVDLARAVAGSGATKRVELMLACAENIAEDAARAAAAAGQKSALLRALDARRTVADIARWATASSEDPATVAFAVGNALSEMRAA